MDEKTEEKALSSQWGTDTKRGKWILKTSYDMLIICFTYLLLFILLIGHLA